MPIILEGIYNTFIRIRSWVINDFIIPVLYINYLVFQIWSVPTMVNSTVIINNGAQ